MSGEIKKLCNFNESEFEVIIQADKKEEGKSAARATITFDKKENAIRLYDVLKVAAVDIFKGFTPSVAIRISYNSETCENLMAFNLKKDEEKSF